MPDSNISIYDSSNGKPDKNGGFGDPEVTPKPLRIAKCGNLRPSDPVAINSLPCISTSESQRSLVPVRRSSVSIDLPRLALSQQDFTSPTSHSSDSSTSLFVRKQRRSGSSYSSVANAAPDDPDGSSLVRADAGTREHIASITVGGESGNTPDESKVSITTRPAPTRAFTTGLFDKTNFLSPINDEPLISPTPLVAFNGRQRAVTTNAGSHYPTEAGQSARRHVLRRQPSFKQRLMTVMGGLTHRAHDGHATDATGKERRQSTQLLTQDPQAPERWPRHQDPEYVRRSLLSGTDVCSGSELDGALSAFPPPPKSNNTSPTTTTSRQSSTLPSPRFRNLRRPEVAAIIGPQLQVTSEYEEMNAKNGKTVMVAIDIEGALNNTTSGQSLWNREVGLDVAVIIDNSLYTSASTLMASCETARSLASMLNVVLDRMAILCTSAPHAPGSDSILIRPLSQPNTTEITSALDCIPATTIIENSMVSIWEGAINNAKDILLQSTVPNAKTELLQDIFGHVFVLTAIAEGLSSTMLAHDKLQFHVICPGTLARENHRSIECNGWKLRSMSGTELRAVSAKKDADPASLLNRLRRLIMHARGGKLEGHLTDIVLDVVPGQDCQIEGIMGSLEYSTLNPGQISTVLVSLRINTPKAQADSLSHGLSQSVAPIDANSVWRQLDQMLGFSEIKLATAILRYKHSLLPEGTTCSISADCHVKKELPSPGFHKRSSGKPRLVPTGCTALIQKRWAYETATHHSPKNALSSLRDVFGETGSHSSSPGYLKLITDELKHQIRIIERLEIDASPKKPIKFFDEELQDKILTEHFGQIITGVKKPQVEKSPENQRPDDWITAAVDESVSASEQVQFGLTPNFGRDTRPTRQKSADGDKTKRVLGYTEKPWKSPRHAHFVGHGQRTVSFNKEQEQERKKTLRDLIGGNKRSLASGTLRNLNPAGKSRGRGMGSQ